ncbi:MAG: DUF2959 domain-containing protein [Desulfobulbaceae bacterium]|nr:DUF2959 domain-containing protein [Desulfobulbaceae bacterium]
MKISVIWPLFIFYLLLTAGCQQVYYTTLEKAGIHKRDLMVNRVEDARDAQEEVKEQFQSALEQFTSVVTVKGGDLQQKYEQLDRVYVKSKEKADLVHKRIADVEKVSGALFDEWEDELREYSNTRLREDSRAKMNATRRDYERLIKAMKSAEKKIHPVLTAFHDQVLYLKHNLNAQAISSLQNELVAIEDNVAGLVKEMEASIREAEQFIAAMRKQDAR